MYVDDEFTIRWIVMLTEFPEVCADTDPWKSILPNEVAWVGRVKNKTDKPSAATIRHNALPEKHLVCEDILQSPLCSRYFVSGAQGFCDFLPGFAKAFFIGGMRFVD